MARAYLSNVDAAMLQLDDPTNMMMITGVMVLGSPIDIHRLEATLESRLLGMARFHQRLAWSRLGTGRPYWKDSPGLDLGYHLQRARLGVRPSGSEDALREVVSLLASTPLDLSRPPWQIHAIEDYGSGSALVLRLHHAIADGTALVGAMLSLTDSEPNAPWPSVRLETHRRRSASPLGALAGPARSRLKATRRTASDLIRHTTGVLHRPSQLLEASRIGRATLTNLARFLLLEPDPNTALRGELGTSKRAAWSAAIPLEDVKVIRRELGGTVNDVLLAAVAGTLRRYLQDRGEAVDSIGLRATVPVNVRQPGSETQLGNRVGAIYVPLPLNIADPECRLREIVRHVNGRKDSGEAFAFYAALNVLGQAPARIANSVVNTFGNRATVVMTNVRGPQEHLYLAGSPLEEVVAWVPTTGRMGIGVSVLSYAGVVRLGVLTDEGLVPDPETIVTEFHAELEALLAQAITSLDGMKE